MTNMNLTKILQKKFKIEDIEIKNLLNSIYSYDTLLDLRESQIQETEFICLLQIILDKFLKEISKYINESLCDQIKEYLTSNIFEVETLNFGLCYDRFENEICQETNTRIRLKIIKIINKFKI